MKVIFINRKKLGIIVILMGLMITLLGVSKGFDKQLKTTILVKHNINLLDNYSGLNGKITYRLPEGWTSKEKKFLGGEVIYHNEFRSSDAVIHGFVEVWSTNRDLKTFLDSSKKISEEQNVIRNYKIDSANINGRKTYIVQYLMNVTDNNWYKVYEYFIDNGNEFYRFSFFTRNVNFKEAYGAIYESIVETFKTN